MANIRDEDDETKQYFDQKLRRFLTCGSGAAQPAQSQHPDRHLFLPQQSVRKSTGVLVCQRQRAIAVSVAHRLLRVAKETHLRV